MNGSEKAAVLARVRASARKARARAGKLPAKSQVKVDGEREEFSGAAQEAVDRMEKSAPGQSEEGGSAPAQAGGLGRHCTGNPVGFTGPSGHASLSQFPSSAIGTSLIDNREVSDGTRIHHRERSGIPGGTPCFRGTRVPVESLIDYLEAGDTLDEFLDNFPSVRRDAAIAALEDAKVLLTSPG